MSVCNSLRDKFCMIKRFIVHEYALVIQKRQESEREKVNVCV